MRESKENKIWPSYGAEEYTEMTHKVFISSLNKYSDVEFASSPERPEDIRDSDMTEANFLNYDLPLTMLNQNLISLNSE